MAVHDFSVNRAFNDNAAYDPAILDPDEIETELIQLAHYEDPVTGAIGTPHGHTVTFAQDVDTDGVHSRTGKPVYAAYYNQTREGLESIVAAFEGGGAAFSTGTGRAANALMLGLLEAGSHIIVAPEDIYPGTRLLFESRAAKTGLQVSYCACTREAIQSHIRPNTRMIFTETLTNPGLQISDIKTIVAIAKENRLLSVVDKTLTPFFRPLKLGADIVTASATKYLFGHNNGMGGLIAVNPRKALQAQILKTEHRLTGPVLEPDAAARLIVQMQDFPQRYATHSRNARAVAAFLKEQPEVAEVLYPGFRGDDSDRLAREQFGEFTGGVLSFKFKDGVDVPAFLNALNTNKAFATADSLGGAATLTDWYWKKEYVQSLSDEERRARGFTPGFVRAAIGRGSARAQVAAFSGAFDAVRQPSYTPAVRVGAPALTAG